MFKSIRWRITITYFSLFLLTILLLSGVLAKVLENYFKENLIAGLTSQTVIAQQFITANYLDSTEELDQLINNLGATINTRITVIDVSGEVIGDSDENARLMENHRLRPEFQQALEGSRGVSTRYSSTIDNQLTYVALPLEREGQVVGAVRLSIPLTHVTQTLHEINAMLLWAFSGATIIFIILSLRLSSIITKPLENLTRSAKRIALGELSHRSYSPNQGEIGELQQAINFMAEKQQEKIAEIADKKSKLEAVLEHMSSGLIVINQQRNIELINHAAEKLLYFRGAKVIGKSCLAILRDQDLQDDLDKVLTQGKVLSRELYLEQPTERFLQVVLAPVYHNREIKEGVIVLTDITTIKQLEKMRSQFVANVSHELRTPLTSIMGFVETLQGGVVNDPETSERFLGIIASETERLSRLIEDILELSKIEASKHTIKQEPVNLNKIINQSIQQLAETAEKKGLFLSATLLEDYLVIADNDGLKQVFLNLLQNSINYTPTGGRIEVKIKEKPNHLVVSVADTGVGIPATDLPRIFERFYRVDKARSREMGGTGLGLSIVKHLVESFNGTIWAESKEGEGTVFYFTLLKSKTLLSG